jgi:hypothetical protein
MNRWLALVHRLAVASSVPTKGRQAAPADDNQGDPNSGRPSRGEGEKHVRVKSRN